MSLRLRAIALVISFTVINRHLSLSSAHLSNRTPHTPNGLDGRESHHPFIMMIHITGEDTWFQVSPSLSALSLSFTTHRTTSQETGCQAIGPVTGGSSTPICALYIFLYISFVPFRFRSFSSPLTSHRTASPHRPPPNDRSIIRFVHFVCMSLI